MASKNTEEKVEAGAINTLRAWGENPVPPMVLATLITAQYMRPFQALPMIFPPILIGSSYANLNGYKKDAGGITAAWSGIFLLLAHRRRQTIRNQFSVRGAFRGATVGVCLANLAGGGTAYILGRRSEEVV